MRAIAIIGSAWGDEGKGAATDKLVSVSDTPLVVRYNGGGQAGHTVVTPDGRRHVFSHFCSGALAGAPGYLSEFFVANPRVFITERKELADKEANLNIGINPKAMVTTPIDIMFNRAIENKRGDDKHGSVGVGFGETIERDTRGFPLSVKDLIDRSLLEGMIERIIKEWVPTRSSELGVDIDLEQISWVTFFAECDLFMDKVNLTTIKEAARKHQTIIFEGAQGLLLDQSRGMTFPHVTRSNTGLQNVVPLLNQLGLRTLRAIYMMRPYMTRHGAGPLPGEVPTLNNVIVEDKTNVTNPWQGNFRLAPLDPGLIIDSIKTDLGEVKGISVEPHVGISCVDHGLNKSITEIINDFPAAVTGHGPSRDCYHINSKFRSNKSEINISNKKVA